jgi:hypothetical protein
MTSQYGPCNESDTRECQTYKTDAAAARDVLGEGGGDLPIAAVAAVMKRKAVAEHEANPATIAERRRRRLCDLLPALFDTVR